MLEELFGLINDDDYDAQMAFLFIHVVETMPFFGLCQKLPASFAHDIRQFTLMGWKILIRIVNNPTTFKILKTQLENDTVANPYIEKTRDSAKKIKPDLQDF